MTKEQFEQKYSQATHITEEYYHANYVTLKCRCGADECHGWACVRNNEISIKHHRGLYQ